MIHLNQDRLNSLSFLDYLKEMHSKIEGVRHTPKSNSGYDDARTLCLDIKYRFVKELKITWEEFKIKQGRNLRQSEEVLDKYRYAKSDKAKSEVIKEFVSDYGYDLQSIIFAMDRHKQDPNSAIED